jgi:hypothetical protein
MAEDSDFVNSHGQEIPDSGQQRIILNGCPDRPVLTPSGQAAVRQPKVRDMGQDGQKAVF